ncbi:hypothetical protein ABH908_003544 [Pseudomonas frederiksbergensis]|jgi:hypothetical protein|uniref:hypothetical protein n=1 Tax=Pseudomonas TaxID=286 RepID=UPI00110F4415|nr:MULTISPECIES: hypothetical protein [unclassified Pseudomonas]QDV95823.1 hypothetical protein FFH90_016605 [Pseudomonas sp. ATCC 43928]
MRSWVSQSVGEVEGSDATFSGRLLWLFAVAGVMAVSGCSVRSADSFTLVTELPPGFSIKGEASYVPRTGEACTVPPRKGRNYPGLKFFEQKLSNDAQTARFEVPLTSKEGGCPLVLDSFGYEVDAKYGADFRNVGRAHTGISFRDGNANSPAPPSVLVLQKQCQWFFRTAGPDRYIVKILKCKSVETPDLASDSDIKGPMQRAQFAGKTIKVIFAISSEERPAVGDNWVQFPTGWKRCMGDSLEDPYAFCDGNKTDFKPFKMPDGRDCTVYPNCTE